MFEELNHHAYLLIGDRTAAMQSVKLLIERLNRRGLVNSADVFWSEAATFDIENSRDLGERHGRRSFAGGRKLFVIAAQTITLPAQHALLKIFEDPPPRTHFFLIDPQTGGLLPTLKSRCQTVRNLERQILSPAAAGEAKRFLASGPNERLGLISRATRIDELVKAIEFICRDRLVRERSQAILETVEIVLEARRHLTLRSALPKLIGEQLALTLPKI